MVGDPGEVSQKRSGLPRKHLVWHPTADVPIQELCAGVTRWLDEQIEQAVKEYVEDGFFWIEGETLAFQCKDALGHVILERDLYEVLNLHTGACYSDPSHHKVKDQETREQLGKLRAVLERTIKAIDFAVSDGDA